MVKMEVGVVLDSHVIEQIRLKKKEVTPLSAFILFGVQPSRANLAGAGRSLVGRRPSIAINHPIGDVVLSGAGVATFWADGQQTAAIAFFMVNSP